MANDGNMPRDTHRDLPDENIRHGKGYPTFHELDVVLEERDEKQQVEARLCRLERRQGHGVIFAVVLGIIAFALIVAVLVLFFSGTVR